MYQLILVVLISLFPVGSFAGGPGMLFNSGSGGGSYGPNLWNDSTAVPGTGWSLSGDVWTHTGGGYGQFLTEAAATFGADDEYEIVIEVITLTQGSVGLYPIVPDQWMETTGTFTATGVKGTNDPFSITSSDFIGSLRVVSLRVVL